MKTMGRTLKSIGFVVVGGMLVAASGCAVTDLLQQLLQGIIPGTSQ